MTKEEKMAVIAKNTAALLNDMCHDSLVVNLGVGLPLVTVNYLDNDAIFIHTENGMMGVGPLAFGEEVDPDRINAGSQPIKETVGCSYTDSSEAFGMIRGGHVDVAVLGAFQVDGDANIANWIIPSGKKLGVGGAMDLVVGARTVIVAMTHTGEGGKKLVDRCTLPITAFGEADYVITEMGVFHFAQEGPLLEKIHPNYSIEQVQRQTGFPYKVSQQLTRMVV